MKPEFSLIKSFFVFMDEGGNLTWIILGVWFLGMAMVIERLVLLYRYKIDGKKLFTEIHNNLLKNDLQGALLICSNTQAVLAFVLRAGLKKIHGTAEQIEHALDTATLEMIPLLEKRLSYLGLIANI